MSSHGDGVVLILFHMLAHIQYDQRPNQTFDGDLLDSPGTRCKVGRGIKMRAVVLLGEERPRKVSVTFDVPQFFSLIWRRFGAFPVGAAAVQVMS